MESENKFVEQHEAAEKLPAKEEIKSAFETILDGKEYKELRVETDEKGVFLYEIEAVDEDGEKMEYLYQRAKNNYQDQQNPPGARFSASIHVTYYNVDGIPYHGKVAANYLDGNWIYITAADYEGFLE